MNTNTFQVPTQRAARHARPGVDLPVFSLQQMIATGEVGSFIACQHPDTPFENHWFVYAMGRPTCTDASQCLGVATAWADRPLALPTLDDVVELMLDIGWDGLLQVAAEPVPLED